MMKEDKIVPLKGPDRIRRRPAVVFGDDGKKGVTEAILLLLDLFVTEAVLGFSGSIVVKTEKDGSVSLQSFDRGLLLDETPCDGKPLWYYDFCDFGLAPREPDREYIYALMRKHHTLYGEREKAIPPFREDGDPAFFLCAVQYCSEWMEVESVHGKLRKHVRFEKGFPVTEMKRETVSLPSYTKISFKPDCEVFTDIFPSTDAIAEALRCAAVAVPLLSCTLSNEERNETFCYPLGGWDYVKQHCRDGEPPLIYRSARTYSGQDRPEGEYYDASLRVCVGFVPDGGRAQCIHNVRPLPDGGVHLQAVKKKIVSDFRTVFGDGHDSDEQIEKHLFLVLESECPARLTRWENGQRRAVVNPLLCEMAEDLLGDFEEFLRNSKERIQPLIHTKA